MPDFFGPTLSDEALAHPLLIVAKLIAALGLGALVAFVYQRTRPPQDVIPSFTTTIVLLSVLIAMVTQVIGDNVARAFSLVGALSIVRFRTVVRDTQDTAYVIFAVAVGMAIGANNLWVAIIGLAVVSLGAFLMSRRGAPPAALAATPGGDAFVLHVRIGLGHDVETLLGPTLDAHLGSRLLMGLETARQGAAIDVSYRTVLRGAASAGELVRQLNRIDGVQSVALERVPLEEAQI